MPQVAPAVARERAARLRVRAVERKRAWLAGLVGGVEDVLVERPGDRGRSPGFAEVRLPPSPPGSVRRVRIAAATDTHLEGVTP